MIVEKFAAYEIKPTWNFDTLRNYTLRNTAYVVTAYEMHPTKQTPYVK